jgi:hypothetical protein
VTYDPGRFQDFVTIPFLGLNSSAGEETGGLRVPDILDVLTPYLQFRYTFNGEERQSQADIHLFQDQFILPDAPEIHFLPSANGFRFPNFFSGIRLPFTVPFLPEKHEITGPYGLCGGMSAAACDYFLSGRAAPLVNEVPRAGTRLYRYLFRRAMDSFAMGASIIKFARWMTLPDDGPTGAWRLTLPEYEKLRAALEKHKLAPIGLVITAGKTLQEIGQLVWSNHQILAYGYTDNADGSVDIHVYDPNSPACDDAFIHITRVVVGTGPDGPLEGIRCQPVRVAISPLQVRGFFLMPYTPAQPPERM